VKLRFLGTRGEIESRTDRHARHSSLLVAYRGADVVVDWGLDWRGRLEEVRPGAIVLTHAHPDHAGGLRDAAPCPVYTTAETWRAIRHFEIDAGGRVPDHGRTCGHPLRAGRRLYSGAGGGDVCLTLYVGDGASITRSILRRRDDVPIGHASIREQLDWCAAEGVSRAIFSHSGS
jgi:glyoxylase-like metal-dependent hydrolase (beta-lactamase superfamily II)